MNLNNKNKKRILYVIHKGGGGTPYTNEDLMRHIQNELDCYVLTSNTKEIKLWQYKNNNFIEIYSWHIKSKWSAKNFYNPEFRDIYFNVLKEIKIDIVHIRHLFKHTFDLPEVATSLGIPLIISFHDFYYICPSLNLLDENNNYCAGKCTPGQKQCYIGNELNDLPNLKIFVKKWRNVVKNILIKANVLITTSDIVKQIYSSVYPELSEKIKVIEHGRDFKPIDDITQFYEPPSTNKPIKILVPGNINIAKGGELIKNIKKEDKNSKLEFHFIGSLQSNLRLQNYGIYHGPYKREDFNKLVNDIKPSFIGIFSICPETYCHTLSEAWSCGVPVLTTKLGAQEERLNKTGGGWFIDHKNPLKAYKKIIKIANSPKEYNQVIKKIEKITFKSTEEMANEYKNIYSYILNENCTKFLEYSHTQINNILNALSNKISVIIPIYNAYEETKECIDNVLGNTKIHYELILVDDCSPDERIGVLLNKMESISQVKVIHNNENKGFVKSANIGIQNSNNDIVLLNSDTKVTPKWLQKLVAAAYSDDRIGTVTPFSNAAGAFSVPELGENEIPSFLTLEEMASLVEKVSDNINMEVPTGNGFCMFIKRETINDVGIFDEKNFGKGYGEENDFCMRAIEKSWKNIIDDSTYIYHKGSSSFSNSKERLMKKNRAILDKKHPSYTKKVHEFLSSHEYENIRNKVKTKLENREFSKKRILYVIHKGGGGTPYTNEDLMRHIQNELDCYVLTSNTKEIKLWQYKNNNFIEIYSWHIKSKWSAKNFYNPEFRDIYFNVLKEIKIDIVHIRHLFKHTFDLPEVATSLGIPLIISFHDFYYICPSLNLLDENNNYCAGKCTPGQKQCYIGNELNDLPNLKIFVKKWRNVVKNILIKANVLITTSDIVKQIYSSVYPELSEKIKVIEHGRDFKPIDDITQFYEPPSTNKPIKILVPGNINIAKGGELIKNIKKEDKNSKLEFHFIGSLQSNLRLQNYGIYHGPYKREDFNKLVNDIKPSFIGIFSICPETYCHTLSEAWSCGVPVLTTKLGAQEERLNKTGGGWFIDHKNPLKAYKKIIKIANSPKEYNQVIKKIEKITFKSTEEMANEYKNIYSSHLTK